MFELKMIKLYNEVVYSKIENVEKYLDFIGLQLLLFM